MKLIQKLESSFYIQLFTLIIIALIFYWPSLLGGTIFIDDDGFIFKSAPMIESNNPLHFWDRSTSYARSWPLSYTIFWLIYQFAKTHYWIYKLINLCLHIFNALLITKVFKKLATNRQLMLAALIYLIHPIQIETVSWIFQLKTILATTFFLLSYQVFQLFLERRNIFIYTGALYLYLFSLLSIVSAVLLPVLILYETLKKFHYKSYLPWVIVLPFFLLSFRIGFDSSEAVSKLHLDERLSIDFNKEVKPKSPAIHEETEKKKTAPLIKTVEKKIKIAFTNLSYYLSHFFFPVKLSIVQEDVTKTNLANITSWIFCACLLLFILLNYFILKIEITTELYLFIFFLLSILPILGFVHIPFMNFSLVADHWIYLGMAPFCLLTVILFERINKSYKILITVFFVVFWSYQSLTYIHVFNHRYKLLERVITMSPHDYRFPMELATTLLKDKKLPQAQKVIEAALEKPPLKNNMTLLLQGGYIDRQLGDKQKLSKKIFQIGMIYIKNNEFEKATLMLEQLKEVSSDKNLISSLENSLKK